MSQWNMAQISIGCILIMVANQMEQGKGLMLTGVVIAGAGLYKFIVELKRENKKQNAKTTKKKNKDKIKK